MSVYIPDVAQFCAKVESTEGTAETPAAADCKNLVGGISVDHNIPAMMRDVVADTHDQHSAVMGGPRTVGVDFRMPLKGSGVAGTAPACDPILEAMNLLGVNTSISETYDTTVHTANKSLTLLWKVATSVTACLDTAIVGSRGSGSIELNNGMFPVLAGHFEGKYVEPVAGTFFSSLTEESTDPVAILGGAFTLDSEALNYRSFTINIENDLEVLDDTTDATGVLSTVITKQRITFSIDPAMEIPGTYNFFNKLTTNADFTLSLPISGSAGNIITITAPKMQFTEIKFGERGYLTAECSGQANRNTDADPSALTIAFT